MCEDKKFPDTDQSSIVGTLRLHGWSWMSCGAIVGLVGAIVSPLFGSLLTTITWFTGPEWHGFHLKRSGTALLLTAIPLLILGAHCLDLMDRKNQLTSKTRQGARSESQSQHFRSLS